MSKDNKNSKRSCRYSVPGAVLAFCIAIVIFGLSPLSRYPLSLAVMKISDRLNYSGSLEEETGIRIRIPGGGATSSKDWYPFVMNFRADADFNNATGQSGGKLSVYYNFAAFDIKKGCSDIYNPASPYYSSFYGAYLVRNEDDTPYGFMLAGEASAEEKKKVVGDAAVGDAAADEGLIPDTDAIALVTQLDYSRLVLMDFGLMPQDQVFDWEITGVRQDVDFAHSSGWTMIEAEMTVNGMAHNERKPHPLSYLQYGVPADKVSPEAEFAAVAMHGILYGKYLADKDVSVFFYVMSPGRDTCRICAEEILAASTLS